MMVICFRGFFFLFSNGVGRSGMFILIYVGMQEINHGDGIVNIQEVGGKMLWQRRYIILKQDQLKYCYEAILYYAQDVLAKGFVLIIYLIFFHC